MRTITSSLLTMKAIRPHYVLAVRLFLCFIFGLAATLAHGKTRVAMIMLVLCFEWVCGFALSYSLTLRIDLA
jgi:FHS family L-fucose permease-like MFS transporter